MSRTLTFPNVTPELWNQTKIAICKDSGEILAGDAGNSVALGHKYSYEYSPSQMTLTIVEMDNQIDP